MSLDLTGAFGIQTQATLSPWGRAQDVDRQAGAKQSLPQFSPGSRLSVVWRLSRRLATAYFAIPIRVLRPRVSPRRVTTEPRMSRDREGVFR